MNPLAAFASRFGAEIALNPHFVVEKSQRHYLLNPSLNTVIRKDFFYAGLYLGKTKNGKFFPSFNFLNMLVDVAANKVFLDRKTAWLFICGRDIFRQGIVKLTGAQRRGDCALVLNEYGECLGFGEICAKQGEAKGQIVVRNILDIGDFLRRET